LLVAPDQHNHSEMIGHLLSHSCPIALMQHSGAATAQTVKQIKVTELI
jgi:hypothetical protein